MRRTLRLLAGAQPSRYLIPGNPTGLTGLYTHSSPRSSLLYLYSRTLEKLGEFPESSVYRQSIEALTKHRMAIVEAAEPPGYKEWAAKAQKILEENPEEFSIASDVKIDGAYARTVVSGGKVYLHRHDPVEVDQRDQEWDGELDEGISSQGLKAEKERIVMAQSLDKKPLDLPNKVQWESEPQLTAEQYVSPSDNLSYASK